MNRDLIVPGRKPLLGGCWNVIRSESQSPQVPAASRGSPSRGPIRHRPGGFRAHRENSGRKQKGRIPLPPWDRSLLFGGGSDGRLRSNTCDSPACPALSKRSEERRVGKAASGGSAAERIGETSVAVR